jgi:transitional endoplasmic reticulum ATPase
MCTYYQHTPYRFLLARKSVTQFDKKLKDRTMGSHTPHRSAFAHAQPDKIAGYFFNHSDAHRVNTDAFMYDVISRRHPGFRVTVVPEYNSNLLAYAVASPELASSRSFPEAPEDSTRSSRSKPTDQWPSTLKWTLYQAPARRLDGPNGNLAEQLFFGSFLYYWRSHEFLVYLVEGRDGTSAYPQIRNQYILSSAAEGSSINRGTANESNDPVYDLIREVGQYTSSLHEEIWVYNDGFWQKDAELYRSILNSYWKNVILPEDLKKDVRDAAERFFAKGTRDTYHRLGVPWKRGVIFYGPPGNGKTISIKATMHTLYSLPDPVPTLYVKSLASFAGPEHSINEIFRKARMTAPCYLVFEDLDSLVTPQVRSFFLNAVDGISENEGILMVGSTNHLDQLDDGISKRPSRFDRKYEFGLPGKELRKKYCEFWQNKLGKKSSDAEVNGEDGVEIDFPDVLLDKIAGITDGFSFAYMQEAFVSTLLVIAGQQGASIKVCSQVVERDSESVTDAFEVVSLNEREEQSRDGKDDDVKDPLDRFVLWKEMKIQVALLKREIGKNGR